MKRKVTIYDIAKALNVDSSTVSRALSGSSRVKLKTKEAVERMALELGYQPNVLASNLRKSKSNTIGVIVPRVSRHFFSSVIAGIDHVTYDSGYNVIICQSLDDLEREKRLVQTLLANRVDGVLISVSMGTTNGEHFKPFEKQGIPLVLFDRKCEGVLADTIEVNDFEAAFKATQHLIENGCERIVHLSGPTEVSIYQKRYRGYRSALEKHGLNFNEDLVLTSQLTKRDGVLAAQQILAMENKPDGIFCASDPAAISAMQVLKEAGVKIPEEIALVGFSNEPISSVIEPSLTTIDQPGFEIGKKASELLLEQILSPRLTGSEPKIQVIDTQLIVRDSSLKNGKLVSVS